jgi:DNA-directed RNA polymerase subunit H (RpoH/RPB5)
MPSPSVVVVRILTDHFFARRGLAACGRGGPASAPPARASDDDINAAMARGGHVRLDAARATPRGRRDWVVVLVLAPGGRPAQYSPDLRKLVDAAVAEAGARLDELIIVAEREFFRRAKLTELVSEWQRAAPGGPDEAGVAPIIGAYPFTTFCHVVPDHVSVQPHRVMAAGEVAEHLRVLRLARSDLPVILSDDPPVVWAGGREGQVVEITRDSQTALMSYYYRRIERAAIGPR